MTTRNKVHTKFVSWFAAAARVLCTNFASKTKRHGRPQLFIRQPESYIGVWKCVQLITRLDPRDDMPRSRAVSTSLARSIKRHQFRDAIGLIYTCCQTDTVGLPFASCCHGDSVESSKLSGSCAPTGRAISDNDSAVDEIIAAAV